MSLANLTEHLPDHHVLYDEQEAVQEGEGEREKTQSGETFLSW